MTDKRQLKEIHLAIRSARRQMLDFLEIRFGNVEEWPEIRGRVFQIFGNDGLERFFIEEAPATEIRRPNALKHKVVSI